MFKIPKGTIIISYVKKYIYKDVHRIKLNILYRSKYYQDYTNSVMYFGLLFPAH